MNRRSIRSGIDSEERYGYSRAVRIGDVIAVAGMPASGEDAGEQATTAFRKSLDALAEFSGGPEDVTRTRMFMTDIDRDANAVGRAHREAFEGYPPAATMVEVSKFIGPDILVEVEIDAVVEKGAASAEGRN